MSRVLTLALLASLGSAPAHADDAAPFLANFSGAWLGTGQLLVGPQSGLKFGCELDGDPSRTQLTFSMKGRCWVGALSAPVHAQLRYNHETQRFYGQFMDGAEGNGLDIVGTRAGEGFSLQLSRGSAQGRLLAEAVNGDQMKVTMFLRENATDREVPVAAMGFARKGATEALPDYLPDVVTVSVRRR